MSKNEKLAMEAWKQAYREQREELVQLRKQYLELSDQYQELLLALRKTL